ncbi:MAG: helix-turn-helix transcriptional regulator [Proteobacteria bacterium]|nr:helix-turn-helix transcriptional regulator [Pseudomonadota bacterium]
MFDDEEHVRLCSLAKSRNYRYALWNTLKLENTRLLSSYSQCNVWNGLTINETEGTSFNAYSFATTKDNIGLNEFFINNLSLFDHFIVYFKQRLKLLLDTEAKHLTFNATPLKDMSHVDDSASYSNKINSFLEQTALQKFEVNINNTTTYLTKRQLQCLRMLAAGKTSKEIGNQLELSQRTVESYINAIKNKTGLMYKSDLISFFETSSLNLYKLL